MTLARRLRIWRQRVLALTRTRALDAELDGELAFHLENLIAEKIAEGLSPADAARAARLEFGNPAALADAARDQRPVVWIHDLVRDAAYGARVLRKAPVFTAVAVVSLALGIGANAAVLAAIDTALVRGVPLPDADRLVYVRSVSLANPGQAAGVSANEFLAWRDRAQSFAALEATLASAQDFAGDRHGPAERVGGQGVTAGFFSTLGVVPLMGRVFDAAESRLIDPPPAIVISERLWHRRFGGDARIIGTAVRVGGLVRTIVGVMPATFRVQNASVDFWMPLRLLPTPATDPGGYLRVIGRLKPGVPLSKAQTELNVIASAFPARRLTWHPEVQTFDEALYGWARRPLLTLQLAVALVLLIGCANVAALLLARGSVRSREIHLRIALGAGRGRVIRQLLTESLLLALGGGAVGLAVAWLGLHSLSALTPALSSPSLGPMALDARVLSIAFGLSVASALAFGTVPAFTASQADPVAIMRISGAERAAQTPRRSTIIIVAGQCALALMLMIGAGLLVNSQLRLAGRDFHFEPDGVLMFDVTLPVPQRPAGTYGGAPYFDVVSPAAPTYTRVLARLRTVPGVESAGGSSYPLVNSLILPTVGVRLDGDGRRPDRTVDGITYFLVTPGFFATMRAPILRGREVGDGDTIDVAWVAVVNESAARLLWPQETAVGRRIRLDTVPGEQPREIIGVVADIPLRHGETVPRPVIYASYLQQPPQVRAPWRTLFGTMTFVLRTSGDAASLVPIVRSAVAEIDPDHPVSSVGTVRQHLDAGMRQFRYLVSLVMVLAGTAAALAAIGVYGTVAYTAGRRVREIGIRKALGAGPWQIAALVASRTFVAVGAGVAAGLAATFVMSRLLISQLWGVAPTDPATYVAVTLLVIALSAIACALPARRAIAADPAAALRRD